MISNLQLPLILFAALLIPLAYSIAPIPSNVCYDVTPLTMSDVGVLPAVRSANVHAFDIDSSNNILTGGSYSNTHLYVGYFEPTFDIRWVKQVATATKLFCRTVKFQHNANPSTQVMAIFQDSELLTAPTNAILILVFDILGNLVTSVNEDTSYSSSTGYIQSLLFNGALFTSAGDIISTFQTVVDKRLGYASVNPFTRTSNWAYVSTHAAEMQGRVVRFGASSASDLFIAAQQNNVTNELHILKVSASTGGDIWKISVPTPAIVHTQQITQLSDSSFDYIHGSMTTVGLPIWLYRMNVSRAAGAVDIKQQTILSINPEESTIQCLSVFANSYVQMSALFYLPSGKMRLITVDFTNYVGVLVRSTYIQTGLLITYPRGKIMSSTRTFIKDHITISGAITADRVRELAGSTASCVESAFTLKNMDFAVSSLAFLPSNLSLVAISTLQLTLNPTITPVNVAVTEAASGAACSTATLPYPLFVASNFSLATEISIYDNQDYDADLLKLFLGDSTCLDFFRLYSATVSPSLTYTLDQNGHNFKIAAANQAAGVYSITIQALFRLGIMLQANIVLTITSCDAATFLTFPTISNMAYNIGESLQAISITAPTMSPSDCNVQLKYSISHSNGTSITTPPFQFNALTRQFQLQTSNADLTGVSTLRFKAFILPAVEQSLDFTTTLKCLITYTYGGPISFTYRIGVDTTNLIDLSGAIYQSLCVSLGGKTFSYTARLSNGSPLPSFITFTDATKQFSVSTTNYLLNGTYTIVLNATINNVEGSFNQNLYFTLVVTNCAEIILSNMPVISDKEYVIGNLVIDEILGEVTLSDPACINVIGYTVIYQNGSALTANPPFTFTAANRRFQVYSNNDSTITGDYTLVYRATNTQGGDYLDSFINAKVNCTITVFGSPSSAIYYYQISDPASLIDLSSVSYYSYCDAFCSNLITYTAKLTNDSLLPGFISFDSGTFIFTVNSNDIYDADVYEIKLIATLDDLAQSFNEEIVFTIDVTNCSNAITSSIQDIQDNFYSIGDLAITILTDPVTFTPSSCEPLIQYEVLNSDGTSLDDPPFTYNPITKQLRVESLSDSTITSIYGLKYRITNNHGGDVLEDEFQVTVNCSISPFYPGPIDYTYQVSDSDLIIDFSTAIFNSYCNSPLSNLFTYSFTLQDGNPLPSFIVEDFGAMTLTVQSSSISDAASYVIKLIATLDDQAYSFNDQIFVNLVVTECSNENQGLIQDILDYPYFIGDPIIVFTTDSITLLQPSCERVIEYEIVESDGTSILSPPFQFNATTLEMSTSSHLFSDITGINNLKYRITNHHGNTVQEDPFAVDIKCRISASFPGPITYNYQVSDGPLVIDFSTATITSFCSQTLTNIFTYSFALDDDSLLPSFIVADNIAMTLTVESSLISVAQTYIIRLKATLDDPAISFNEDIYITLVVTECSSENSAPIQDIQDDDYLIGDPDINFITDPITLIEPSCERVINYEILNFDDSPLATPPFSYNTATREMIISSTLTSSVTQTYNLKYKVTNNHGNIVQEDYFTIDVKCSIISDFSGLSDQTYQISDVALPIDLSSTIYNGFCLNSSLNTISFEFTYQDGSALPSFITTNNAARTLSVHSNSITDSGIYPIKLKATLNDPAGAFNEDVVFILIVTDCSSESLVPIQDITTQTYSIGGPDVTFTTNLITLTQPSCSSVIVYNIVNADGSILANPPFSFDGVTREFVISSLLSSSVTGTYSLKYVITNNHGGAIADDSFGVDIKCDILSDFSGLATQTYQISDTALLIDLSSTIYSGFCIDSLPGTLTFDFTFQNGSALPSFITRNNPARTLSVQSNSITDSGTYPIKLKATLNDPAAAFNEDILFTLEVTDCSSESLFPIEDIPNYTYQIGGSDITFTTNLITLMQPSCERVMQYNIVNSDGSPLVNPPFLFNTTTRQMIISSPLFSSVTGTYNLKYVITNNHGGANAEDPFVVDIKCDITASYFGSIVFNYQISDSAYQFNDLSSYSYSSNCLLPPFNNVLTYDAKFINGSSLPAFITFNPTTLEFSVLSTDISDANTYEIALIATLNDGALTFNDLIQFTLIVTSCVDEILFPSQTISDQYYEIGQFPLEIVLDQMNLIVPSCERVISYTMTYQNSSAIGNPPFTYDLVNTKLIIDSSTDSTITGLHQLSYSIANAHTGNSWTETFDIQISCGISYSFSGPYTYTYQISNSALLIPLSSVVYSSFCTLSPMNNTFTYTAKLINGDALPAFIIFDDSTLTLSVQSNSLTDAGQLYIKIIATLNDNQLSQNEQLSISLDVLSCALANFIWIPKVQNINYFIGEEQKTVQFGIPTMNVPICLSEVTYNVLDSEGYDLNNSLFSFDSLDRNFVISSLTDPQQAGTYDFIYRATNPLFYVVPPAQRYRILAPPNSIAPPGSIQTTFQVTASCQISKTYSGVTSFSYQIGASALSFNFSTLAYTSPCTSLGTYTFSYTAALKDGSLLPIFISHDASQQLFVVKTSNVFFVKKYSIKIIATLSDSLPSTDDTFIFQVDVFDPNPAVVDPSSGKMYFSPLLQDQILTIGEFIPYSLPAVIDPLNRLTTVLMDLDTVRNFVTYTTNKQFLIKPFEGDEGIYLIKLTIIDNSSPRREDTYYLRIEVKGIVLEPEEKPEPIIPTEEQLQELQTFKDEFKARITRISMQGIITIQLNKDWGFSEEFQNFSNVKLNFRYYPFELQQNITLLDWKVLKFERRILSVFLNFSDPIFVSQYSEKDQIGLDFQYFYKNQVKQRRLWPDNFDIKATFTLKHRLPQQISDRKMSHSQFIRGLSRHRWHCHINQQCDIFRNSFRFLFPIFLINFPANVFYLKMLLMEVTNMEILPYTENLNEEWQALMIADEDQGLLLEGLYQQLGYDNCFYIYNLRDNLISLVISLLLVVVYFIVRSILRRHLAKTHLPLKTVPIQTSQNSEIKPQQPTFMIRQLTKLQNYLNETLFYSAFLRIGIQSYFELCIITSLIFYQSFYFNGWKAYLNSSISIPIGVILVLLPGLILIFLKKNYKYLFNEDFSQKYSTLYENIVQSRPKSVYFTALFLVRRLIYALSIQMFSTIVQISIQMVFSICMLAFLISVRPMSTNLLNFMEVFNELTYLSCLYISFFFTDYADSYMHQYSYGFIYLYILMFNLAINVLVLVIVVIKDGYSLIKKLLNKKKKEEEERVRIQQADLNQTQFVGQDFTKATRQPMNAIRKQTTVGLKEWQDGETMISFPNEIQSQQNIFLQASSSNLLPSMLAESIKKVVRVQPRCQIRSHVVDETANISMNESSLMDESAFIASMKPFKSKESMMY